MNKSTIRSSLTLLLLPVAGWASSIISDDFNELTTGDDLGPPWEVAGTCENATVTVADVESPFSDVSGGKSVFLNDTTDDGNPQFIQSFTPPDSTTTGLSMQFDFLVPASDAGFQLAAYSGGIQAFPIVFAGQGTTFSISYRDADAAHTLIAGASRSTWYRAVIETPAPGTGSGVYSLSVTPFGGTATVVTNVTFRNPACDIDSIRFMPQGGHFLGNFYIDNVIVQPIPEPPTAGSAPQ